MTLGLTPSESDESQGVLGDTYQKEHSVLESSSSRRGGGGIANSSSSTSSSTSSSGGGGGDDDNDNDNDNGNDNNNSNGNNDCNEKMLDDKVMEKIPLSASIVLERSSAIDKINTSQKEEKIMVRFKPIGSIEAITPTVVKVSSKQNVSMVIRYLCKKLRVKTVYLYIQNSFQPTPDDNLGNLFNLFKTNNELIVNYCNKIAFG